MNKEKNLNYRYSPRNVFVKAYCGTPFFVLLRVFCHCGDVSSYFCPEAKGYFDTAVSFLRTFVPKQKYQKFSAQKERWLDTNIGKNGSLGKSALTSLLRRGGLPLTFGVVRNIWQAENPSNMFVLSPIVLVTRYPRFVIVVNVTHRYNYGWKQTSLRGFRRFGKRSLWRSPTAEIERDLLVTFRS